MKNQLFGLLLITAGLTACNPNVDTACFIVNETEGTLTAEAYDATFTVAPNSREEVYREMHPGEVKNFGCGPCAEAHVQVLPDDTSKTLLKSTMLVENWQAEVTKENARGGGSQECSFVVKPQDIQ